MSKSSEPLFGLSGTLWPIHLKPLPDELLSSWVVRFAHAHGCKVQTMCLYLFGRNQNIWSRDIDKLAPDWMREVLTRATGATAVQFEQTTLRAFEGVVVDQVNINGMGRGFVPLGVFHRSRTRAGLMWCPHCLREDNAPYFRKAWRLVYFTVCTRHQVYLEDACHRCKAPVVPHRSDMFGRNIIPNASLITHCYRCRANLQDCLPQAADVPSVRLHATFELALSQGYIHWNANPSLYSVLFFDGLSALISGLISKRGKQRLLAASIFSSMDFSQWPTGRFEMTPLSMRRQFMSVVARLLDGWPENFADLIRQCRLRYSDLKGDRTYLPFWFEDVIRRDASRLISPVTPAHAESIAQAVETHFGTFNGILARRLSGRDVLPKLPSRRVQSVSHELYEALMVALDHEIAGSTESDIRVALLRDKVMFAAGRVFGLSTTRLSKFTLHECRALAPTSEDMGFFSAPATVEQARSWVEWYWAKIRPELNPCASELRLFISAVSGCALKKSSISLRFSRAVSSAGLDRSIGSYAVWKAKT
jgi:hypothetical protein